MKFQTAKRMIVKSQKGGYAVPAFNCNGATYGIMRAALEAAVDTESPLILQAYEPNLQYRGFHYFVVMAERLCDDLNVSIPVALHLDHGHSFQSTVQAMKAGFTSVMIDASHLPVEENAALTNRVSEIARIYDCTVEAEIGYVKGNEISDKLLPGRTPIVDHPPVSLEKISPEEVLSFLQMVDIDMVAVSVGTMHGIYKQQTGIDFSLLEKIRKLVDIPLVQHGTGGISLEDLSRLSRKGMAKINFGEPFRFTYIEKFLEYTENAVHQWHAWRIDEMVKNTLKDEMITLIGALGSTGKA